MLVPIFNNHNQIIEYVGTSEEDEPIVNHRLLDGAVFRNAITKREFSFSASTRTWTERIHPDTQAALDRATVLEADVVELKANEVAATIRLDVLTTRMDKVDPPTPPGGP